MVKSLFVKQVRLAHFVKALDVGVFSVGFEKTRKFSECGLRFLSGDATFFAKAASPIIYG